MKEQPTEGPTLPFNHDVVDVSKGFLTRIPYKKKVKSSKLDSLLERRLKQHVIEERQRVSASNPQTPAPSSSTSTSVLSTPARPRSPLKPHALAHMNVALGEDLKGDEKSSTTPTPGTAEVERREIGGGNGAELSKTLDKIVPPPVPSPATTSTPKDNYSTVTHENQITSIPQALKADLVGRTTGPKETNLDSSGQEGIKLPDTHKTTAGQIYSSGSEAPNLKSDSVRPATTVFDPKSTQNTAPSKPVQQNAETLSSVHLGTEENGMGPVEKNMQGVEQGRTASDSASESVSPLPQVNGNDGSGSDGLFTNSVLSSNNGVLTNSPQLKNSFGKEQGLVVSLKGSAQQKRLVNGDLAPVNDSAEVGPKEPSLASKAEGDSDTTISDQDYKPPLKVPKVENNVDADARSARQHISKSPFHSVDANTNPVVKIIRMAPSPIPSAEESSLSDDFADENSHSGTTEPLKTILTQVTTTSTTTTTTTVVSTETTTVNAPAKSSGEITTPVVSTTESSAVSTLTTMTKTTVTKICSSGFDSQSEDSQSEILTQDQKTAFSASMSKMTTGPGGETSVSSVTVSQEDSSSTKGRVRLLKFSRTKKTRSDTALPSYRKFVTKSNRRSIFVLPHDDLKVLGRRGGFREVPIFSYNAKPAWDIWPYPSPRPTFGITWR